MQKMTDDAVFRRIQQDEATAVEVYGKLSAIVKDRNNSELLAIIATEEQGHYETFKKLTNIDLTPNRIFVACVICLARVFGITFTLKLMERREKSTQAHYQSVLDRHPELVTIVEEEERHEQELLGMLEEELLNYVGSMILGLNDALVELTGALTGFTFAFRDTKLIALSGLITGISASLSMSASEYLSHRASGKENRAGKAALYTGAAYIFTVILLILPYLLISNYTLALLLTMSMATVIILVFNLYISVAKDLNFHKHFFEMMGLSLGVAAISFGIGILARKVFDLEI